MIKLNKYLVCRWGITIGVLIGIVLMIYCTPHITLNMSSESLELIWKIGWIILIITLVAAINSLWWLSKENKLPKLFNLFLVVGIVIGAVLTMTSDFWYMNMHNGKSIDFHPFDTIFLVAFGLNVFIAFFYELVSKRACKLIYKGGE